MKKKTQLNLFFWNLVPLIKVFVGRSWARSRPRSWPSPPRPSCSSYSISSRLPQSFSSSSGSAGRIICTYMFIIYVVQGFNKCPFLSGLFSSDCYKILGHQHSRNLMHRARPHWSEIRTQIDNWWMHWFFIHYFSFFVP